MPLQVPCGKCIGCRADNAMVWGIRMYHESTLHKRNSFLTLTYADSPECLNIRDLQLFLKRLRKLSSMPLRYFACGEYGEISRRPHYHVCMFGEDFRGGSFAINDQLYSQPQLVEAWRHGFVSVGDFTVESAMYTAGYVNKKLGEPDGSFRTMSRRPGLGRDWLVRYSDDLRRSGVVSIHGREYPVPKRYLDWLPDVLDPIIRSRRAHIANRSPEQVFRDRESLKAREINKTAKVSQRRSVI